MGGPIAPEQSKSAVATVVTDYPEKGDIEHGRMMVGPAGQEFDRHMRLHGMRRDSFNYTAACMCRPPGDDMAKLRRKLKKINKKLAAEKKPTWLDPVTACRPRLMHEVKLLKNTIVLGNLALEAVIPSRAAAYHKTPEQELEVDGKKADDEKPSVFNLRGTALDVNGLGRIVPMLHPGFVTVQRSWMRAFNTDIARAVRWFKGETGWVEPKIHIQPTVEQLDRWLSKQTKVAHDWETELKGQLDSRPYCIAFGNGTEALVVPLLSIDGQTEFYNAPGERERLYAVIRKHLRSPKILWVGHNSKVFDNTVTERIFGCVPLRHSDTIMLHRSAEPNQSHALAYVGSIWTELERAWKSEGTATGAKSDKELWVYCGLDTVITWRCHEPLVKAVVERGCEQIVQKDYRLQDIYREVHKTGMLVDMKRRNEWDTKLRDRIEVRKKAIRDILGWELGEKRAEAFNPASSMQVADLLFERWQLPIYERSELTDEPSTGEEVLLQLRLEAGLEPHQIRLLDHLRFLRRDASARNTRIARLRDRDKPLEPDEQMLAWEKTLSDDRKKRNRETQALDDEKTGLIRPSDGRFHQSILPHATPTGRLSMQLTQNWPRKMRDIFIAGPGNVLIGLDADQGELRVFTNLSGAKVYVDCFEQKGDPHTLNALLLLGEEGRKLYDIARQTYPTDKLARKGDPNWSKACDQAKNIVFASQYWAHPRKVFEMVRAAEDDSGNLVNPDLTYEQVKLCYDRWLEMVPEIVPWWNGMLKTFRDDGYLLSPYWLRRNDFEDGENKNELVNYPCQSCLADVVNEGTFQLVDALGFRGKYGPGIINQVHDALLVEVKQEYTDEVMGLMKECLDRKVPGHQVEYTFSGHIGWKRDKKTNALLDQSSRWAYTE